MLNFRRTLRARRDARLRSDTCGSEGSDPTDRKDAGFTLPELLIAILISGMLIGVLSTAIVVMITATPQAEDRLSESKDITFLQTWIPVDLATAVNSYPEQDDAVVKSQLTTNPPNLSYDADLSSFSTNVLTLVVPTDDANVYEIISYRYEIDPDDGSGMLVRYRIRDAGTPSEAVDQIGVAREIPGPPNDAWQHGDPVDFAFEVTARNQVVLRPIGEDITVTFESGNVFRTGGAGLSAEQDLAPNDPVTLPDPTAPPTRCGGRVALVLDTSWSVPRFGGGAGLESAATGFIDAFTGTPTFATVMGFDGFAYSLYPNLNHTRGEYFSLLDPSIDSNGDGTSDIETAKINIEALPDRDNKPSGQSDGYYYNGRDGSGIGPVSDRGVNWSKMRTAEGGQTITGYTNWEDALHAPFFDQGGTIRPQTPELVVWITDGDPNTNRDAAFSGRANRDRRVNTESGVASAKDAANRGRSTGARIIGVFVGPDNAGLEANLADVVGSNKWNGTGPDDPGNAVAADYFTGSFSQLGDVLKSIIAAQCGGTVTVRKQLDDSSNPGGRWNYSTETGDQVLDLDVSSSITFDFAFEGQPNRLVTVREEAKSGFSFLRGDCQSGGQPLDGSRVTQSPDDIPGVEILLEPDEAVSCVMVSVRN